MKIKNIISVMAVVCILVGHSCSKYVDVVPDNIAEIEDAFKTRDAAERFLATLYNYLPQYEGVNQNPALASGDEIAVNDNVSQLWPSRILARGGQTKVSPLLGYWGTGGVENLFIALRDCNIFLENVDKPFDLLPDEKKRWIAEAKFLKAYYHFYLLRMYGPIPIVRENIEVSAGVDAVRVSRDPVNEVAGYIVELLDEAIPDLPSTIADEGAELGRITAPIAAAIKARTLVTVASPLFNGNSDYSGFVDEDGDQLIDATFSAEKWTRAAEACQEAIEMAEATGHSLYRFAEAEAAVLSDTIVTQLGIRGSVTERWNQEIIWGASGRPVSTLQNWSQAKIANGLTAENRESVQSWWSPPLRIAEMFYSDNGVPINEDVNYDYVDRYTTAIADNTNRYHVVPGYETAKLHFNREPRFYASMGFDGGIWYGHGVKDDDNALFVRGLKGNKAGKLDAQRFSGTGYWAKKLVYYENVQSTSGAGYSLRTYPFPVVRLADLYLLYAEALNESDKIGEAQNWVDQVRQRAGLDGVVTSWSSASNRPDKPTTKEGLREIIQDERMIELVFEGQRFWDLRRWKRAVEFLNGNIQGWNIQGETPSTYYNVVTLGNYRFLNRDYLWPISETDIIANSKLIQNPGW